MKGFFGMDENNKKEKKKVEKLKKITVKDIILYWVMAIISVILVILLMNYNKRNWEKDQANSSSTSACITSVFLDYTQH
jgi:predicted negative regulator of RcsB-dependent stress response